MRMHKKEKYGLLIAILAVLAALAGLMAYSIDDHYKQLKNEAISVAEAQTRLLSDDVKIWMEQCSSAMFLSSLAVTELIDGGADKQNLKEFFARLEQHYRNDPGSGVLSVFAYLDGHFMKSDWMPTPDYDPTSRAWFKGAMEGNGEVEFTGLYTDAITGNTIVSAGVKLPNGRGLMGADFLLTPLQMSLDLLEYPSYVTVFIMDSSGKVVAHKESEMVGKNLTDGRSSEAFARQILETKNGSVKGEFFGINAIAYYANVGGWYVVSYLDEDRFWVAEKDHFTTVAALSALALMLLVALCMYCFIRMLRTKEKEQIAKNKLECSNRMMIRTLTKTIDAKDHYTNGHSMRVASYAEKIAHKLGKPKSFRDKVYYAGLLHDVGKINVPEEVINKKGKLTDEEYAQVKVHPIAGFQILRDVEDADSFISDAARYHHERFDGRGYPCGLAGDDIPEVARIVGMADAYDAMASNRSYRSALPQSVIVDEIKRNRGRQFDPRMADAMLELIGEDQEYSMRQKESDSKIVLIVDDDYVNSKLIADMLRREVPKYSVVFATSGKECLKKVELTTFDLILLDVQLSDMDGFRTYEAIRKTLPQTPVVFMTADRRLATIRKAMSLGVYDYITKPVSHQNLASIVMSTLRSNR